MSTTNGTTDASTGTVARPNATTIAADGALLECFVVPWDTAILGFPVAEVTRLELGPPETDSAGLFRAYDAWCADLGVRLSTCRLDHLQLRESMELEAHGFRFVETVYTPRLDALAGIGQPRHPIQVSEATVDDMAAIEAIAAAAFTTGRYLLDHRLAPDVNGRRYVTWVRSAAGSSGQTVLKAELDGELVGFFVIEERPDHGVYWHLTAMAPTAQGRGIGRSVWETMLQRHGRDGHRWVETTISGHNLAVMNLYARLGFRFSGARLTFHRLVSAPA